MPRTSKLPSGFPMAGNPKGPSPQRLVGRAGGNWLPRAGLVASAFTAMCCVGLSVAVSLASGIGATFLTQDSTLQPLLIISLAITIAGSAFTFRRHRNPLPLLSTVLASAWIWASLYGPLNGGIGVEGAVGHDASGDAVSDGMSAMSVAGRGGGISPTTLVWVGLGVLLAAQIWDFARVRRCAIPPSTHAGDHPA